MLQNASVWLTHSAEFVFTTDAPKEEFVMPIVTGTNQIAAMQLAIRSGEAIGALEVRFTDLYSEDGKSVISKDNFKYSFVETWHMTNNSTQTPANLLIRAPQDMPDILSDKKSSTCLKTTPKASTCSFTFRRVRLQGSTVAASSLTTWEPKERFRWRLKCFLWNFQTKPI